MFSFKQYEQIFPGKKSEQCGTGSTLLNDTMLATRGVLHYTITRCQ